MNCIKQLQIEEEKRHRIFNELKIKNKELTAKMLKENRILQIYSCQRCQFEIVSEEKFIIIPNKFPLCKMCKRDGNPRNTLKRTFW